MSETRAKLTIPDPAIQVRAGVFPDADHSYKMNAGEAERLAQLLAKGG